MKKKYDLKDRLIDFAVRIIKLSEKLPNTKQENIFQVKFLEVELPRLQTMEKELVQNQEKILFIN